jgi:hypothetical protein
MWFRDVWIDIFSTPQIGRAGWTCGAFEEIGVQYERQTTLLANLDRRNLTLSKRKHERSKNGRSRKVEMGLVEALVDLCGKLEEDEKQEPAIGTDAVRNHAAFPVSPRSNRTR